MTHNWVKRERNVWLSIKNDHIKLHFNNETYALSKQLEKIRMMARAECVCPQSHLP